MVDIVKNGDSIEGLSIEGCSRDPLVDRGLHLYNEKRCNRYVAAFNVKSQIVIELTEDIKKIDESAHCNREAELTCDKAIIHSMSHRFNSIVSSNVSSTHSANTWAFPKQTNVKITIAHEQILNAIRTREIKETGMSSIK